MEPAASLLILNLPVKGKRPMDTLALIFLLAILAGFVGAGLAVMFALMFEDVEVRPMTEDEFLKFLSRPPSR